MKNTTTGSLEAITTDTLTHVTGGGWKEALKKWARGHKIDKDIERHGEDPGRDGKWRPA